MERETPVFMAGHGNSINNTNAIQTKLFLRDPHMHMYPLSKFHFSKMCRSGVRWGGVHSTPPPLGQGVGPKHLGRARVNIEFFKGGTLLYPGKTGS